MGGAGMSADTSGVTSDAAGSLSGGVAIGPDCPDRVGRRTGPLRPAPAGIGRERPGGSGTGTECAPRDGLSQGFSPRERPRP